MRKRVNKIRTDQKANQNFPRSIRNGLWINKRDVDGLEMLMNAMQGKNVLGALEIQLSANALILIMPMISSKFHSMNAQKS